MAADRRHHEEGMELMRKAAKILAGLRGRVLNRCPDWGAEAEPSLPPPRPPSLWGTMRRANGGRRPVALEKLLARMGSAAFRSTSAASGVREDVREEELRAAEDEITAGAAPPEMSSPDTPLDFAAGSDADASASSGEGGGGGEKGPARADGDRAGQSVADKVDLQEAKKIRSDDGINRDEKGCLLFDLNEDAPMEED